MVSPIVSTEALAGWIDEGRADLRIVDVRWYLGRPPGSGRAAYDGGHLPGAMHLDLDTDLVAPTGPGRHPLPDPSTLAAALGARGIGDGDLVVAYDDVGGWVAARLWWMLDDLGFRAGSQGGVLVLDGGLPTWVAEGRPLSTEVPALEPASLHLASRWRRVVDRQGLRSRLGDVLLLDARAAPRYRGEIEPIDPQPGHIPTAVNAPVEGNLGPDGRFRPSSELRARFTRLRTEAIAAGMPLLGDPGTPVVTSCGSGVSACHNALAMRIAGLPDAVLYPGSYSDWSSAGDPVVIGAGPGRRPG
ncbi:MAG: sulfurtransferase [Chloroflexota bacterium]